MCWGICSSHVHDHIRGIHGAEVLASTLKAPKAQGFESAMEIGLLQWYQVVQWQPSGQNFWIQPRKSAALCKSSDGKCPLHMFSCSFFPARARDVLDGSRMKAQ